MNEERSAEFVAQLIEAGVPFVLPRYGDGDIYMMKAATADQMAAMMSDVLGDREGRPPLVLADGEEWSLELREALWSAWDTFVFSSDLNLLLGDFSMHTWGPELQSYWLKIKDSIERPFTSVHPEMFWLSCLPQPKLLRLIRAIRHDWRQKLLVGREELRLAGAIINSDFMPCEPFNALEDLQKVRERAASYDIVLFCCGRASKPMIAACSTPEKTLIDIGSLFDPLFIGLTRPRALAPTETDAESFFTKVAGFPVKTRPNRPGRAYGACG